MSYEHVKAYRQRRKTILVEAAGGQCVKCGYDRSLAALQFHHRDPTTKSFSIASSARHYGVERCLEEIKKCDLLCANCHAELHEEERA